MTPGPDQDAPTGLSADSGERYERGELIATGGMGQVWRARDQVLGREVAVKVLKHEYAEDPTFRARFAAEARHAAGLHHPGIASVFDYGVLADGRTPYLVMELVHGKPLSELLSRREPFDPEQARLLALQTAEALAVAHAAGVVHRDVKPANLLVTPEGRVKITDFGIARALGSASITQTGEIIGTPHYLSPEQAHGHSATPASDVYALGVVLFECLSGHRPFDADTPIATALAHIQQETPPLPDDVPPALAAVVRRAMSKEPADRFADGAELAAALRAAEARAGVAMAPVPAPSAEETRLLPPAVAPVPATTSTFTPPAAASTSSASTSSARPAASRVGTSSRWRLYLAAALLLVLVAALAVAQPWNEDAPTDPGDSASQTGPVQDSATPQDPAPADTVEVDADAYVGEPVADAEAALSDLGLETTTEDRQNPGTEKAGIVADLDPTGSVEEGSTVTLQVWGAPPAEPSEEDKTAQKEAEKAAEKAQKEAEKAAEKAAQDAEKAQDNSGKGGQGNGGGNG